MLITFDTFFYLVLPNSRTMGISMKDALLWMRTMIKLIPAFRMSYSSYPQRLEIS